MKPISFLLAAITILFCASCWPKHTKVVQCQPGVLQLQTAGFAGSDFYPAPFVIRYKQDNAFDYAIDTLSVAYQTMSNDTFSLYFTNSDTSVKDSLGAQLLIGYDYKIVFPADTLVYKVTNLNGMGTTQVTETYGDQGPQPCFNNPLTLSLNGITTPVQLASSTASVYSEYLTYITLTK